MGLDMYLRGKKFLWSHGEQNFREIAKNLLVQAFPEVAELEINELSCEVAYWRKANAIHNWFVKNTQDGVDNCQNTPIDCKQLQALLDDVNKVLADRALAHEILPTKSGFFFGRTDYDEYYIRDLTYTKQRLELLLSDAYKGWEFEYHSSW